MTIEQNILARKEANEILSLAIDCAGDFSCPAAVLFWAQIMAYVQSVLSERLLPVRTVEKPNRPMTPDEMEDFNRSEMPWGRHQGMSISLIPLSYLFWIDDQYDFRRDLRRYLASDSIQREQGDVDDA